MAEEQQDKRWREPFHAWRRPKTRVTAPEHGHIGNKSERALESFGSLLAGEPLEEKFAAV